MRGAKSIAVMLSLPSLVYDNYYLQVVLSIPLYVLFEHFRFMLFCVLRVYLSVSVLGYDLTFIVLTNAWVRILLGIT